MNFTCFFTIVVVVLDYLCYFRYDRLLGTEGVGSGTEKRHYESVLQRELDGLDDEFSILKFLSQELQVRANSIRNQRFPNKKAA